MKLLITMLVILFSLTALASAPSYYPENFIKEVAAGKLTDNKLKEELYLVLSQQHQKDPNGGADTLGCKSSSKGKCYSHVALGYGPARKLLFGKIHLQQENGRYFIEDVYCKKIFAGSSSVGPGAIPNNNQINCEHTWPQSKFNRSFNTELQKSDLHHLYPTDSKANSVRGNYNFADVQRESGALDNCGASKSGSSYEGNGDDFFEPPTDHKGNVARAIFYFSIRYQIKIPVNEEKVLRRWNDLDPVDDAEMERNEIIHEAQGNRNPFIDFPQLANYINRF